jgi:carbamoylphosphate synthase large subunit
MNVQFAVQEGEVYVLEVNPRASRTVPFVSKAIGVPLAKLAALVMAGHTLKDLGFHEGVRPRHYSVKEAVFPFARFPGIDVVLSPEMKSTGEVMGIDRTNGMAFLKSQVAAGNRLPEKGADLRQRARSGQAALEDLGRVWKSWASRCMPRWAPARRCARRAFPARRSFVFPTDVRM